MSDGEEKRLVCVRVPEGGATDSYLRKLQQLLGLNMAGTLRFAIFHTYSEVAGQFADKHPERLDDVDPDFCGESAEVPEGALDGAGGAEDG